MTHRYPTRYQSKMTQLSPASSDEDTMIEEEVRQEPLDHQQQQHNIFLSLIPHEMKNAIESILIDLYDEKIVLTTIEKKEAEQIYSIINASITNRFQPHFMTYHYPIICRLHSNIELFTYMKHNHELVRRFHHLATIFHDYYDHFTVLYSTLWNKCIDPSYDIYKEVYLPYCTLLFTIKDIIHTTEMIFIDEKILKYY